MARPRKTDAYFQHLIDGFVRELATAVTRFVAAQGPTGGGRRRPGRRPGTRCYVPGCKNIAAPRYGMFCVAKHRDLSKAEKQRYRAQHERAKARTVANRRGRRGGRK